MPDNIAANILKALRTHADEERALHHAGFFKTHKGGYGEGDVFWGLSVPDTRSVAAKYWRTASLDDIGQLLNNEVHEARLCALAMLVKKMQYTDETGKKRIVELYERNLSRINNWDLVDISAPKILGPYYLDKARRKLWALAKSGKLWSERVAVLSTLHFIRNDDHAMTLELCEYFLGHKHDLMHKATGWMLREVGKRDKSLLLGFLEKHAAIMPRTMLRYSLEKLPEKQRREFMRRRDKR